MVEALLEREIAKLKKEAQEKDDRIKALELAASDAQSAITGPSHALASVSFNELEAGLPKLRNALQCAICTELFTEPHTVDCGHTFCYQCLKQWLQIRKQCPTCRKPLTRHPMLSFTVQHQVEIYLAHFTSKSEGESYQKRVENGRNVNDPWQNIFRKERTTTYLEDAEDDTRRCPECNWELVGQQCVNCGEVYHDAPDDSEEGESVNTGDEVESFMDANESDQDFIVDDDVVDYEDADSVDEILDADAGSDTEHEDDYVIPSIQRNRHSRRPAVVVNLSSDSESESDGADSVSAMTTKRSAPFISSDDDDFQLPLNRSKKRKTQDTSKNRNRKVIALDDSDDDEADLPGPSDSQRVRESSAEPAIDKNRTSDEEEESSQGTNKKRAIRDTSDEEESGSEIDQRGNSSHELDSEEDDDDLKQGLLELDEMASKEATSHQNGKTAKIKSKKNKKSKKHKRDKHVSKSGQRKGKGKAKA